MNCKLSGSKFFFHSILVTVSCIFSIQSVVNLIISYRKKQGKDQEIPSVEKIPKRKLLNLDDVLKERCENEYKALNVNFDKNVPSQQQKENNPVLSSINKEKRSNDSLYNVLQYDKLFVI